jgi:hypothetical protein
MPNWLSNLLLSRKFWLAVVALAQTILFNIYPNFSPALWQSIDGLIAVILVIWTIDDNAAKAREQTERLSHK